MPAVLVSPAREDKACIPWWPESQSARIYLMKVTWLACMLLCLEAAWRMPLLPAWACAGSMACRAVMAALQLLPMLCTFAKPVPICWPISRVLIGRCAGVSQALHSGGDGIRHSAGAESVHVLVQRAQMGLHTADRLRGNALLPHWLREFPRSQSYSWCIECSSCCANIPHWLREFLGHSHIHGASSALFAA